FGLEEGAQLARVRDTLLRALKLFDGAAAAFLAIPALQMELGGLTPWGRFVRHRRDVDGVLRAEIARRRADGTAGRTDVRSMLVEARDEYGEPMTDQELLDEMFTILGAGHETTAISMSWALHHVLGRPDVLERIEAEHRNVAGEGPVEPDHLGKLEYLDAVIKESARLTPVATQVLRRLKVPMRIGGWDLPAGINVSAAIYATHHRADLWPEPERFDPDRFVGTRPSPYSFFPFGGGERRCLGAAFAQGNVVTAGIDTGEPPDHNALLSPRTGAGTARAPHQGNDTWSRVLSPPSCSSWPPLPPAAARSPTSRAGMSGPSRSRRAATGSSR